MNFYIILPGTDSSESSFCFKTIKFSQKKTFNKIKSTKPRSQQKTLFPLDEKLWGCTKISKWYGYNLWPVIHFTTSGRGTPRIPLCAPWLPHTHTWILASARNHHQYKVYPQFPRVNSTGFLFQCFFPPNPTRAHQKVKPGAGFETALFFCSFDSSCSKSVWWTLLFSSEYSCLESLEAEPAIRSSWSRTSPVSPRVHL